MLLLALVALLASTPPAGAAPRDDAVDVPAASRAAYLAEQLREDPVYISDQVPRAVPRSTSSAYRKLAARPGVPTYVLLLPSRTLGADREALLAEVHDRLGRDGLYVLLDESGIGVHATTFGVDLPAEHACRATLYELPPDAGPLKVLTHFVEVLETGDREAARRAETAAEDGLGSRPERLHTSRTDRRNQSFLAGILLTGVPVLTVLLGWQLRRSKGVPWVRMRYVTPAAVTAVLVLATGLPWVFDDTRSTGDPPPTEQDMTARTDRVAEALRDSPVYADPESAAGLSPAQRRALSERAEKLDVPVRIAVVPLGTEDESNGDGDLFASKLHRALGEDALYVVAQSEGGSISVLNYGARLDGEQLHEYTEEIRYGPGGTVDYESPDVHGQLNDLLTRVEKVRSGPPGKPYLDPLPAEDPVEEDALPSVYSGDFSGGAVMGALCAPLLAGGVAAGRAVRRRRRSGAVERGVPVAAGRIPTASAAHEAPGKPGTGWLRRTARRELQHLNAEFTRRAGSSSGPSRARAWKCLDAATLLLDQEGDGLVDAEADAPTLATAVMLLRAGQAALRGDDRGRKGGGEATPLCALNPLHGPATGHCKFQREGMAEARSQSVCSYCRRALTGPATREAALTHRLLRLRAGGAGPYVPYDQLPGPLGASGSDGIITDHLVDNVLEYLGVH